MSDINVNAPEFKPEYEEPRRRGRPPKIIVKPTTPEADKWVRVCCIVECKPWVQVEVVEKKRGPDGKEFETRGIVERPLVHGETAEIPSWIADILIANKHAVRV